MDIANVVPDEHLPTLAAAIKDTGLLQMHGVTDVDALTDGQIVRRYVRMQLRLLTQDRVRRAAATAAAQGAVVPDWTIPTA